ncbi:hypothetical protein [Cytobacillus sp. IB215665]|uniref:hypothetical protein n=1 Tax=Cytobacillus sp. IB215665 TaxID=3097357 RepID=UPI002A0FF8E8|nr:hypothetical protein [Cytobacillus sp. IB215665]MDX8367199.1 hypothetical protein [Cytobacillus sp. IB215665]
MKTTVAKFKNGVKNRIEKEKAWMKNETSQVTTEVGGYVLMGIILAGGIITLAAPKLKTAFGNSFDRMVNASSGPGLVADPFGTGQADWSE